MRSDFFVKNLLTRTVCTVPELYRMQEHTVCMKSKQYNSCVHFYDHVESIQSFIYMILLENAKQITIEYTIVSIVVYVLFVILAINVYVIRIVRTTSTSTHNHTTP